MINYFLIESKFTDWCGVSSILSTPRRSQGSGWCIARVTSFFVVAPDWRICKRYECVLGLNLLVFLQLEVFSSLFLMLPSLLPYIMRFWA